MAAPIPSYQLPGGGKTSQLPLLNPEQMSGLQNLLQFGQNKLTNPQAGFEPFANLARQRFQSQTIPSIAERFTALGNDRRSSAFEGALGSAASDLESQLAALGSQYGLQNEQSALNFINAGLRPTYENIIEQRRPGFFESLLGPLSSGASAYGTYAGLGGSALGQSLLGGAGGAGTTGAAGAGATSAATGLTGLFGSLAPALPFIGGAAAVALPFLAYKLLNK